MDMITVIISIASLVVATIGLIVSLKAALITINNSNKYSHINYVLEINKKMIDDPILLSIYDDKHPMLKVIDNPILVQAKQEAFCHYVLNVYEIIYDHYKIDSSIRNTSSKKEWIAWKKTIENMIKQSTVFRQILNNEEIQSEYSDEFISFMKEKLLNHQIIIQNSSDKY